MAASAATAPNRAASTASAATIPRRTCERLAGCFRIEHTLAEMGARRLWQLLKTEP